MSVDDQRNVRSAMASWVYVGLVFGGVIERVILYAQNRSLWIDEAALARGLSRFSWDGITRPLPEGQVAPALWLMVSRALVALFGPSEYVLRLFPLVAGLASVVLFALLAWRVFRDQPLAATIALACCALAPGLVAYTAEVKPYSCDVMVAIALPLAALWTLEAPSRTRWGVLAAAGAISIWLSFPALFVLVGVWLIIWLAGFRRPALALAPVWLLTAAPVILMRPRLVAPVDRAYLDAYWDSQLGFRIHPIATIHEISVWALGLSHATICVGFVLVGVVGLLVRSRRLGALLLAPILAAFLAAMLRLYPLSGRTALWLAPVVALLLGASVVALIRVSVPAGWLAAATLVLLMPLGRIGRPAPITVEELRPVVAYLAAHRRATDQVYVYYATTPAWHYYAPAVAAIEGGCHRLDWPAYLSELDSLPSGRVWIVASHFFTGAGIDEVRLMRLHLGQPIDSVIATNAGAWLYDLPTMRASTDPLQAKAPRASIVLDCGPPAPAPRALTAIHALIGKR
jgi:hypothetical protein